MTTVVFVTSTGNVVVVVASAITVVVAAPVSAGAFAVAAWKEAGGVKPSVQWSHPGPAKCGKPLASMEVMRQPFMPQSSMGVREEVIMRLMRVVGGDLGKGDDGASGQVAEAESADTVCEMARRMAVQRIALSCILYLVLTAASDQKGKKNLAVNVVQVWTVE